MLKYLSSQAFRISAAETLNFYLFTLDNRSDVSYHSKALFEPKQFDMTEYLSSIIELS